MEMGGKAEPRPLYPREKSRYSLYRRLGDSRAGFERLQKNSFSPEFDPRNVQPVASHYTDYMDPFTVLCNQYIVLGAVLLHYGRHV